MYASSDEKAALKAFQERLLASYDSPPASTLPQNGAIQAAQDAILNRLPSHGRGINYVLDNLSSLARGLNESSRSPNYYGFVTGGATQVASAADVMATTYDQNVQVQLPSETAATTIEAYALRMLCELLDLEADTFNHRTFTTGATASNILGLACGRESVIARAAARRGLKVSTGSSGIVRAMREAELDEIQVLTSVPHSSLAKAASVVGLGRDSVVSVGRVDRAHKIDFDKLESMLRKPRVASIVAISCGEVNTGFFATTGEDMKRIRTLCDEVGAYIHVDGAFGLMARCLAGSVTDAAALEDLQPVIDGCQGLEHADSITGDAHKLLNVPYDCGFFLSRSLELATSVFQNAGAAYLNAPPPSGTGASGGLHVPSPLNIGLENSRRFRALPVYASLVAYGRDGYAAMLLRQIGLAREVSRAIAESEHYELLPAGHHEGSSGGSGGSSSSSSFRETYIVVLFRARDHALNAQLVARVNATGRIYVSGTRWEGRPAARIAVSNWQADAGRDAPLILDVLRGVYEQWAGPRPDDDHAGRRSGA